MRPAQHHGHALKLCRRWQADPDRQLLTHRARHAAISLTRGALRHASFSLWWLQTRRRDLLGFVAPRRSPLGYKIQAPLPSPSSIHSVPSTKRVVAMDGLVYPPSPSHRESYYYARRGKASPTTDATGTRPPPRRACTLRRWASRASREPDVIAEVTNHRASAQCHGWKFMTRHPS